MVYGGLLDSGRSSPTQWFIHATGPLLATGPWEDTRHLLDPAGQADEWHAAQSRKAKSTNKVIMEITGEIAALLERIAKRKSEKLPDRRSKSYSTRLIVDDSGLALGRAALRYRFDKARDDAGITKGQFQFPNLRAKAGTDKADSAKDIREGQAQLGHSSVTTTEIYVRKRGGIQGNPYEVTPRFSSRAHKQSKSNRCAQAIIAMTLETTSRYRNQQMTVARKFEPKDGNLLYHYCSPETFLAICTGKKLRFCDIFTMNDYMEMHWGYRMWERAASTVIDLVGQEFLDRVDAIVSSSGFAALPIASCLSTKFDTLSQWRAYAQDGLGFCVGFDAHAVLELPVTALVVCYDEDQQLEEIQRFLKAFHSIVEAHPEDKAMFFQCAAKFAIELCAYKNPAFIEEAEVRLIHLLRYEESGKSLRLFDAPGTAFRSDYAPQPVKFSMKSGSPVAHLDLDLTEPNGGHPIKRVVIGPKNQSLTSAISIMLETMGIPGVEVIRSEASYR